MSPDSGRFWKSKAALRRAAGGWVVCGLALAAPACGDGASTADFPREPTEIVHGECSIDASGSESCVCEPGYTGARCEECDAGYVASGEDCVREAETTCMPGYAGADCTDCAPRYHREGARCVRDERCSSGACPSRASCDDSSGQVVCECFEGYEGDNCEQCSDGYHSDRASCVPDQVCEPDSCSGHGVCDDSDGVIACVCDPGFRGARCSRCDTGFSGAGDECTSIPKCEPGSCSNRGECSETGLGVLCACAEGYAGEHCEGCADDFVLVNGACVPLAPEAVCSDTSCSSRGTCDDSSGRVVCDCRAGYAGVACQLCSPGRVRHADGDCRVSNCGDGIRDPQRDEACDDGNTLTEACPYAEEAALCTVCRSDCTLGAGILNYCGDGDLDAGETCDDGPSNGSYRSDAAEGYCNETCSGYGPFCGDAAVHAENEECDLGLDEDSGNSDTVPDRCRSNCRAPRCGDGVVDTGEDCDDGGEEGGCPADCQDGGVDPEACSFTLTHSVDTTTIEPGNSISCNTVGRHSDNGYLRIFDLDAFGITKFEVEQVRVGIQEAAGGEGTQPIIVRIYSGSQDPPTLASLTQVAEETAIVADTVASFVTVPIEGVVEGAAGTFLAAEVFTPYDLLIANSLFIGSNTAPETDESYLRASSCGVSELTALSSLGFTSMRLLIHVDGVATGSVCEEN